MVKPGRYAICLCIVATAGCWAGAFACESDCESAGQSSPAPATAANPDIADATAGAKGSESTRSDVETGMQVIELAPSQATKVYATVKPDGDVAVSHSPVVEAPQQDE